MNFFNAALDKPYRHRYLLYIINFAVSLHIFMSSKDVQAFLYFMFRAKVSHKTICQWTKKFFEFSQKEKISYDKDEMILLFADEKFVKIKNKLAYWWSVRYHRGNLLASFITIEHDIKSATKLFLMARERIDGKVHAVVRDALASYDKAIKKVFGRKCKSVIRGINFDHEIINGKYFWLSNEMSESLNSQIDAYLSKTHYNFNDLQSANRFVEMFKERRNFREACTYSKRHK